jgi:eukaryotic-like serine/threonine-protein kinase
MGEVYRARDTTLNRDVAIKVLPEAFANDPDRLTRSTREAQMLAALNHPNIAHIHGLESSGGVRALVMELVEGEDLEQRRLRRAVVPERPRARVPIG